MGLRPWLALLFLRVRRLRARLLICDLQGETDLRGRGEGVPLVPAGSELARQRATDTTFCLLSHIRRRGMMTLSVTVRRSPRPPTGWSVVMRRTWAVMVASPMAGLRTVGVASLPAHIGADHAPCASWSSALGRGWKP